MKYDEDSLPESGHLHPVSGGAMSNLPGARSGGMTHHIQGPHLIPNVGREAMLNAEVVRRKPKAKSKVESKEKEKEKKERRKERRERRASPRRGEELSEQGAQEAKRISEERRQQQLLQDVQCMQERKKKQETERKKNLGGVFALSADDFEKEEPVKVEKPSLPRPERPERKARKEVVLDQNAPGSGFAPRLWANWWPIGSLRRGAGSTGTSPRTRMIRERWRVSSCVSQRRNAVVSSAAAVARKSLS